MFTTSFIVSCFNIFQSIIICRYVGIQFVQHFSEKFSFLYVCYDHHIGSICCHCIVITMCVLQRKKRGTENFFKFPVTLPIISKQFLLPIQKFVLKFLSNVPWVGLTLRLQWLFILNEMSANNWYLLQNDKRIAHCLFLVDTSLLYVYWIMISQRLNIYNSNFQQTGNSFNIR